MKTAAVTGKNFGDEGKGLAVDYLCSKAERPLVVRHNGGAQSGHTVEIKDAGKRFVFHELSSGSFRRAGTLWAEEFYPDLIKLGEEAEAFRAVSGFVPDIFSEEKTCVTLPDDVLLNMALESSRGGRRHGSCGMGINECDLRTKAGYGLTVGNVVRMSEKEILSELSRIRLSYTSERTKQLSDVLNGSASVYLDLLSDENVLRNSARIIRENARFVRALSDGALVDLLDSADTLIFEAGQGLLLDRDNTEYAPHVTASSTGIDNPLAFLGRAGLKLDEAVYVTRTYVTRHGAGKLNCECPREELGIPGPDPTNVYNDWQGGFRYARHESEATFCEPVLKDIRKTGGKPGGTSLFVTHLDETGGSVAMKDGSVRIEEFARLPLIRATFDRIYLSGSKFSDGVRAIDLR